MSRSLPTASLLLLAPVLLSFSSCDTPYSRTYAYQKTAFAVVTQKDGKRVLQKSYTFEPYEQAALARAEIDTAKREADRLRAAAQTSQKSSADGLPTDSPSLRMDSGLSSSGVSAGLGATSASIPGLDAPASASMSGSSMSMSATPGMESSMSGSSMSSMSGASMSGASMAAPAMSGASMEGSSMMAAPAGMAPTAPTTPATKPAASTMLPGL